MIGAGGGATLGVARGAIIIDTSQAEAGAVRIKRVSGEIENSFRGIGTAAVRGVNTASGALHKLSGDLQALKGDLLALSLAANGVAAFGLKAGAGIEAAHTKLKFMLGSEEKAVEMMEALRDAAMAAGVPFEDMLKAASQLLPTLEGNTEELAKYMSLARRVATLNPEEGLRGAAFALNEALSSGGTDLVSLSERFQISRFALRDALAQTGGDFAAALDMVLTKMGITSDMADEMAGNFDAAMQRFSSAAKSASAEAFAPLREDLTDLLNQGAEWLTVLQETNPELLHMAGNIAAGTAATASFLLVAAQLLTTLEKIKSNSAIKVGIAGGAGFGLGVAATRGIGAATGDERLANMTPGQAGRDIAEFIQKTTFVFLYSLERMAAQVDHAREMLGNAFGLLVESIGQTAVILGKFVKLLDPTIGAVMIGGGNAAIDWAQGSRTSKEAADAATAERLAQIDEKYNALFDQWFGDMGETRPRTSSGDGGQSVIDPNAPMASELEAFREFQDDLKEIEEEAQQDRLEETARYEDQRTDIIEDYARDREKIIESAEDRIADLNRDIAEQIADVREAAADREAEEQAAYSEQIAEMQADYQRDSIRRLEDFQREEERAKRQHNITLLTAAANLDAKAIWQENLRYNQQRQDREEDFQVEQERRAEEFAERLQQEQEAHEERLEAARKADEKRIRDLQERLAREEAEIRADTENKLAMLQEQHARELAELAQQHQNRLAQISAQEAEARASRETQFKQELISLNGHYGEMLAAQRAGQDAIASAFAAWWDSMAATAGTSSNWVDPRHEEGVGGPGGYAAGGLATHTRREMLHGTPAAPERILNANVTAMLNRMTGSHSDPALLSAVAAGVGGGTGGSKIFNIGNFNTPVYPGMDAREVRQAAYDALNDLLNEVNEED